MTDELSGDIKLSAFQRIQYLYRNAIRNLSLSPRGGTVRSWRLPNSMFASWSATAESPLRILSEAFLVHHIPTLLAERDIKVLDIGCGSGRSAHLLSNAGFGGEYQGLDLDDRFNRDLSKETAFTTTFIHGDVHEALPDARYDLIMSNSALEHIPNDHVLGSVFSHHLNVGGVQVHIVPAPSSLFAYLWHGFRQYSRAAIFSRFGTKGTTVYALGGVFSLLVHILFITMPELLLRTSLRKRMPVLYRNATKTALRLDTFAPLFPCAYAIVKPYEPSTS